MRGDMQVRFGGRYEETYCRKAARRLVPSLREGTHGRAVDLVMRIENCSFPEAMRRIGEMGLTGQAGVTSGQTSVREKRALSGSSMKILGTVPLGNCHLLEYAASRGIDADVIRKYCVEVHYCFEKNPREKYAIGFANDHQGFELRNSMFKGCANTKDITSIAEGNRSCAVFEGFFDLLSFKQYGFGNRLYLSVSDRQTTGSR